MNFNSLVPELDVRDFDTSLTFYRDVLGFTVEYDRINPRFALLSYGEAQLMIEELTPSGWYASGPGVPLGKGVNFQIATTDIQRLVQRIQDHKYPIMRGVEESWRRAKDQLVGELEIHVFDPDGYFLRFSQLIGKKPVA